LDPHLRKRFICLDCIHPLNLNIVELIRFAFIRLTMSFETHFDQGSVSSSSNQQIPEDFDSEIDKLNWGTLCEILDRFNVQVDTLGAVINVLKALSTRFTYVASSVEWQRVQVKALRKTPMKLSEKRDAFSRHSPESSPNSEPEAGLHSNPQSPDKSSSESESKEDPENEMSKTSFLSSDTYDWSKVEDDINLVKEIILMAALMAIFEIVDTGCVLEADFDKMFSHPMLSDWNDSADEALFQALSFLARHFEAFYRVHSLGQDPYRQELQQVAGGKFEESGTIKTQHSPQYPSPKLDPDRHEIRIVELLPGLKDQPIECLLSIASLDDAPMYNALSYAWGSPIKEKSIQLNQIEFKITPNLETALLHLREEEKIQKLWIDAICINQNDLEEKEHQIQLMSKIYPEAQTVLCWLGPEEDDSSLVMQFFQKLAVTDDSTSIVDSSISSHSQNSSGGSEGDGSEVDDSAVDEQESMQYSHASYLKLGIRPWWSRLWTCQEFALTLREPFLICGNERISWTSFCQGIQTMDELQAIHPPDDLELDTTVDPTQTRQNL
jgi:hypothetical protein